MYRIPALPPGEYLVSAAETNTLPETAGKYRGGGGFDEFFKSDALSASFYGGTSKAQDATLVKVEVGSEARGIDITFPEASPHTISGSVISHLDRRGLAGAMLTIRSKDHVPWFAQGSQQFQTDSQGRWILEGVPDGTYSITVSPPEEPVVVPQASGTTDETEGQPPPRPRKRFVGQDVEVSVTGADVAEIVVELAEGASVSGTVSFPSDFDKSYVSVRWAYSDERITERSNSVGAYDGTFTIEGLRAGKLYLNASITGADEVAGHYYVKSITLSGNSLTGSPLTIAEGQVIKDVRIVIANDVARAKVQLLDEEGRPTPARLTMIVSTDSAKWRSATDIVQGTTDARGMLSFTGAPGEYLVLVAGLDESWPPSRDFIRAHAETAPRIKLSAGDNKVVAVQLRR